MHTATFIGLFTATLMGLAGCCGERCGSDEAKTVAGAHDRDAGKVTETCPVPAALIAVMQPTKGNQVAGSVRFTDVEGGVRVVADISGLTPSGKHAFHLHEFGDVSAEDGSAAGGHYNPGKHPHGGPEAEHHHAGDLGNLIADATGNAHYEIVVKGLSLCCGAVPVIGRSVIIHAKEDDLTSQPAGNAGPRIAQGVIGASK